MFFVGIFGGGLKSRELGVTHPKTCPRCHNTEPWTLYKTSKYFSLFFIPVAHWGHRYLVSCPICGEARELGSREEALSSLSGNTKDHN